jgi:hypothetical protein
MGFNSGFKGLKMAIVGVLQVCIITVQCSVFYWYIGRGAKKYSAKDI